MKVQITSDLADEKLRKVQNSSLVEYAASWRHVESLASTMPARSMLEEPPETVGAAGRAWALSWAWALERMELEASSAEKLKYVMINRLKLDNFLP